MFKKSGRFFSLKDSQILSRAMKEIIPDVLLPGVEADKCGTAICVGTP